MSVISNPKNTSTSVITKTISENVKENKEVLNSIDSEKRLIMENYIA